MRRRTRAVIAALALAVALGPGVATACTIDNTASLFVDGVQATLNTAAPVNTVLWAPFTIAKALASGATVPFSELRSDLKRSLPTATLNAPYRWSFGDGATALGHAVSHRFTHPGLYQLNVAGFSPGTHSWYIFDRALVRVVPPDQLLQANLGYYTLRVLDVVMSSLVWLLDAALVALVLYVVYVKRFRRAGNRAPGAEDPAAMAPDTDA